MAVCYKNGADSVYYLDAIEARDDILGAGIPPSLVDFKRYFTLPAAEILRQCNKDSINKARRRCRLSDMWREDFQRRAMSYMQRVGLPNPADDR